MWTVLYLKVGALISARLGLPSENTERGQRFCWHLCWLLAWPVVVCIAVLVICDHILNRRHN